MSERRDSHDATPEKGGANPGYALGQLAQALTTGQEHPDADTRQRADRRASDWLRIFGGMLSGALRIGSRTPIRGVPVWATTRVAQGGFATGDLAAGGPLLDHEQTLLADLPEADRALGRSALNAFFLTEEGLAQLIAWLESGTYRVDVPEEGALLTVAWLATHGHAPAARRILDEIGPWFDRLRFYPVPSDSETPRDGAVRLGDAGDLARRLRKRRVPHDILDQHEALAVWLPHQDRVVALLAETVRGPMPALVSESADGTSVVEGGWPFQVFPDGWADRARVLIDEYDRLRADHQRTGKPDRPGANPSRLRAALAVAASDPARLSGLEVGAVRTALAQIQAKRGLPGSPRLAALRQTQTRIATMPTKAAWADTLADRLDALGTAGLVSGDADALLAPADDAEAERHAVTAGEPIPAAFRQALLRVTDASPEQHVAWGTVSSGEALARVVPTLTALVRSAGISDPALRRLDESVYAAFRRRRSVLLLDLQSQAKLRELPWVQALEPFRESGAATHAAARDTLTRVVGLALSSFPHQILPNKLLQEIRALIEAAGLRVPLVDEVAADIFMGTFTEKYLRAAQVAGRLLEGSLYERYYGIDYAAVLALDDVERPAHGAPTSPAFARLCYARADVEPSASRWAWDRSTAQNGAVIEQEQVLTTHNLAGLFDAVDLAGTLGPRLPDLARQTFTWVADTIEGLKGPRWGQLRAVKNAAYAWRQLVFFLSVVPADARSEFLEWAADELHNRPSPLAERLAPIVADLRAVADDALAPRPGAPFYGWNERTHRLVTADAS
ncbi:hypothetical protein RQM47_17375 [Rubrivirga sp. S365]|uniref:hypothetical protein n=1 Tax=Rubrivirga sp. S365 TaxID=3076080 RepID=UPI0028C5EED8|nr:hypothetical protein [Rubrivirga sp. S365]MDT7858425.1 hypothetical protein [Rubrivirga sp. S365]